MQAKACWPTSFSPIEKDDLLIEVIRQGHQHERPGDRLEVLVGARSLTPVYREIKVIAPVLTVPMLDDEPIMMFNELAAVLVVLDEIEC